MEGAALPRAGQSLGPRVPLKPRHEMEAPTRMVGFKVPSRIMPRDATHSCAPDDNSSACEKPVAGTAMTLPIVLGVVIPVVGLVIVLLFLHRRNMQKEKREDATDPHKSLDFGLGETSDKGGMKRKSILGLGKDHSRYRQLSMDMNLSSPYLLPPGLQSSRESLHSLAKTLHQNEDPYRPVAQYAMSDAASARSFRKERSNTNDAASTYTGSSNGRESAARSHSGSAGVAPPRQNSLPKSPPAPEPAHLRAATTIPEDFEVAPAPPAKDPFGTPTELKLPDFGSTPYPDEEPEAATMPVAPVIQEPLPTARGIARGSSGTHPAAISGADADLGVDSHDDTPGHASVPAIGLAETSSDAYNQASHGSASHHQTPFVDFPPQFSPPQPIAGVIVEEAEGYDTHDHPQGAQGGYGHDDEYYGYEGRGRSMDRGSTYQQAAPTGLGIPEQDTRRLSVGLRPLPPDDLMESEDPETRANRIRSFYKEYFDDSKPEPMPTNPAIVSQQFGGVDYYEDYDQNYQSQAPAPYYDPASNSFVMPYAQPVSRRAMTPPPSGSRFPGPGGPRGPRGPHHGSIGGMSLPPGRGPMRPGSSASSNYGPRPGSSVSNAWNRPRAGSAMSGSRFGGPRKPLPPPAALTTLPNPSKLRDDSFALLGAIDFAPPDTIRDQAAGRSQSPAAERRPYQLNVPIHSPLVTSFDELAALPSPHLLRKSSTFTGLDFAPPRKFADPDNRSDAGSIRSNRSGISSAQLSAIRSGAGRVSRLPEDSIFSAAQMQQKLKPSWDMNR